MLLRTLKLWRFEQPATALGTFTLAGCELYTSCEPCPMRAAVLAEHWPLDRFYTQLGEELATAHGARLAAGVELTAREREGPERRAGCSNRHNFSVRSSIVGHGDGVGALTHDLPVAHHDCAEGSRRGR